MDAELLGHLCALGKLQLEGDERNRMLEDMAGIIALMDTIKAAPAREAATDGGEPLESLRPDESAPSLPTGRLLDCAPQAEADCYAVPMMME